MTYELWNRKNKFLTFLVFFGPLFIMDSFHPENLYQIFYEIQTIIIDLVLEKGQIQQVNILSVHIVSLIQS